MPDNFTLSLLMLQILKTTCIHIWSAVVSVLLYKFIVKWKSKERDRERQRERERERERKKRNVQLFLT